MWQFSRALVGMGCMRLSTDPNRDEARAIATLHAGFDAGVNFLDTADAYCLDGSETGHNERLIARALASWDGDHSRITIATKGGLTRPQGHWIEDGRARHLIAACEASRRALGVQRIDLYQLHAPDPRTPLTTSVRALASLKQNGHVGAIGLCNVNVSQIEEAGRITEIAAVQVELGIWNLDCLLNGVARFCIAHRIPLLAHRPLGGSKKHRRTTGDPALAAVAARHGATPHEIALAWIGDLSDLFLPLPGATRVETAQSCARARSIVLTDDDRAQLGERFPAGRSVRADERTSPTHALRTDGEVVMIMGLPAAGKSTLARTFVAQGYDRLNRDLSGGALDKLLPALDRLATSGPARIVLDNTYLSRKARAQVIDTASKRRLPVRCLWLSTSLDDAQVNAAFRMVSTYDRLLTPDEMRVETKRNVTAFGPGVQFRLQRELEPPDPSEGFSQIEVRAFERALDPSWTNRALIVWCDGVLWRSRSGRRTPVSADDVDVSEEWKVVLRRYDEDGWRLLGLSWQPDVGDEAGARAGVDEAIARMRDMLGVPIEVEYCAHAAGPPVCWCRKPLPGLGVLFIMRHHLDPSRCIYVGNGPQDPGFARRLGFQYREAAAFLAT